MSRFANLPLAVRLAAAFGLQAVALLLVTLLAFEAFGSFKHEVKGSPRGCARSRSPARSARRSSRSAGSRPSTSTSTTATWHQDRIAAEVKAIDRAARRRSAAELGALTKGDPNMATFSEQATTWSKCAQRGARALARRDRRRQRGPLRLARPLHREGLPAMSQLFATRAAAGLDRGVDARARATASRPTRPRARGCC